MTTFTIVVYVLFHLRLLAHTWFFLWFFSVLLWGKFAF